jgi:hypothetical protein
MCRKWHLYGVFKVRFGFRAFGMGRLLYITDVSYDGSMGMKFLSGFS